MLGQLVATSGLAGSSPWGTQLATNTAAQLTLDTAKLQPLVDYHTSTGSAQ